MPRKGRARRFREARKLKQGYDDGLFTEGSGTLADVSEEGDEKKGYHRRERFYGSFQRSIALPDEVDAANAHASYSKGVLKVTLPKSKQPKAQEIRVAVG